jgi:hypothetical protein
LSGGVSAVLAAVRGVDLVINAASSDVAFVVHVGASSRWFQ